MNQHDIRLLTQITGDPCLTITLPTHRTAPENRQDSLQLKNLVKETTERLLGEFNQREAEAIPKRLEHLTGTIDFHNSLDGLALFVNQDFARAKNEEELLQKELEGYSEYMQKTRYRLFPGIW